MNDSRNGNFTSSEIVALTTRGKDKKEFGKPALTYIRQCNMERRLGRSLETDASARPLSWGILLEAFVFEQLGLEYTLTSKKTIIHPDHPYWVGSPDGKKMPDAVTDTKCPFTLQSFCELVDPIYNGLSGMDAMNAIRDNHKDGEKYYWQLVSNSILEKCSHAELIVFMPYKSQLDKIRDLSANVNEHQNRFAWIGFAEDAELPYLPDGGFYKNINKISFKVPQEDKILLTDSVEQSARLLTPSVMLAHHDKELNAVIVQ